MLINNASVKVFATLILDTQVLRSLRTQDCVKKFLKINRRRMVEQQRSNTLNAESWFHSFWCLIRIKYKLLTL